MPPSYQCVVKSNVLLCEFIDRTFNAVQHLGLAPTGNLLSLEPLLQIICFSLCPCFAYHHAATVHFNLVFSFYKLLFIFFIVSN